MASFPTAVKVFTTKNPGDVVQSAHVNDIQDEVNAIEAGYINGTAPLNSSRATPSALSVAGGSTLATLTVSGAAVTNTLQVDGGSTIGAVGLSIVGPLNVGGGSTFAVRPVEPPPHAVRVSLASTRAASSNLSTLTFVQQDYITNSSMHSSAVNPERLTPQSTGIYIFDAQAVSSSNSTGYRQLFLVDSTGTNLARTVSYAAVGSSDVGSLFQVTATKRFDVLGSYVVCVYQNVGASTLSLLANETWFSMRKL